MEPEGLLPHSQVPASCPYPEPARSSPYPHTSLPENPSLYYPPIYAWVSQAVYQGTRLLGTVTERLKMRKEGPDAVRMSPCLNDICSYCGFNPYPANVENTVSSD